MNIRTVYTVNSKAPFSQNTFTDLQVCTLLKNLIKIEIAYQLSIWLQVIIYLDLSCKKIKVKHINIS